MNEDIFKGKWNQMKGKVKQKWGKLTDNDLTRINGERDELLGMLQERYGWEEDHAQEELRRFEDSFRNETRGHREEEREDMGREGFRKEERYGHEQKGQGKHKWASEDEEEGGEGKNKRRKIG